MTEMYSEPKAMEADANLKPYPHEERGTEVSKVIHASFACTVESRRNRMSLTHWT